MTKLSVNINKLATLRNARGGANPDVVKSALDCEKFGAEGITVHPRPDERHIRLSDVLELAKVITTEFNIEGYPDKRYIDLVKKVKPRQATLVPDAPDVLTSNSGWDTAKQQGLLTDVIHELKEAGVRVSLFVDPSEKMVEGAIKAGAHRVELYTEPYAAEYLKDREKAIKPYIAAAKVAHEGKLGINAGHDLDLNNLNYLIQNIPYIDEVSIGHALICDAIYFGLENTIQMYKHKLKIA